MTITVQCSCGQRMRATDSQIGKTFPCPKCGELNTVPSPGVVGVLPREVPQPVLQQEGVSVSGPVASPPAATMSPLPIVISAVAAVVSLAALLLTLWLLMNNPLGKGLNAYDFSSPEQAMLSQIDIELNKDFRAAIELQRIRTGSDVTARERRKTLKVHKEVTYQGKKILFVSFSRNGLPKHDIASFEKDADSGFWFPSFVSTYDMDDDALEKSIKDWKNGSADGNTSTLAPPIGIHSAADERLDAPNLEAGPAVDETSRIAS